MVHQSFPTRVPAGGVRAAGLDPCATVVLRGPAPRSQRRSVACTYRSMSVLLSRVAVARSVTAANANANEGDDDEHAPPERAGTDCAWRATGQPHAGAP